MRALRSEHATHEVRTEEQKRYLLLVTLLLVTLLLVTLLLFGVFECAQTNRILIYIIYYIYKY